VVVFTGIVADTGRVVERSVDGDGLRLRIGEAPLLGDATPGDSVAVSGVCLTVEATGVDWIAVFAGRETRDRTTIGALQSGDFVNLERALPADGRFEGHVVQGHVDATAELIDREQVGGDWRYTWSLPADAAPFVVEKGSIALDGVSLTVAHVGDDRFDTSLVPETLERTTLDALAPGDRVNVEYDAIARYVAGVLEARDDSDGADVRGA
jgi:riboflavin synthase